MRSILAMRVFHFAGDPSHPQEFDQQDSEEGRPDVDHAWLMWASQALSLSSLVAAQPPNMC